MRKNQFKYSEEERKWISVKWGSKGRKQLTDEFNLTFSKNISEGSLAWQARELGVTDIKNKNLFSKGRSYSPNSDKYHIGSEMTMRDHVYVKVSDDPNKGHENWRKKSVIEYEKSFGKVPEGQCVIFLNSDHNDFQAENLFAITFKELGLMNRYNWFSQDREKTLSAIYVLRLHEALWDAGVKTKHQGGVNKN